MKTVRVGLIGAGTVVRTLHAPLLKSFGDVALSWVCDVRIETAREVADAFQIPSAHARLADCGDVDAVLLAIPVGVRDEAWRTAVARGWHVLCEKPAATTVADFDARIGACRDAKRVVTFGLMRRFYQGTLALREVLTSRLFGDPVEIWAGEGGVQQRTARGGDWYQLDAKLAGGGVLIETGSHLLDQVAFATNAAAFSLDRYAQQAWDGPLEFDARLEGALAIAGSTVPFSCVVTRAAEVCNGIYVRFPHLVISLPPGPGAMLEISDPDGKLVGQLRSPLTGAITSFEAFRDEWRSFLRHCRASAAFDVDAEVRATRLSVDIIERCYGASQ